MPVRPAKCGFFIAQSSSRSATVSGLKTSQEASRADLRLLLADLPSVGTVSAVLVTGQQPKTYPLPYRLGASESRRFTLSLSYP